MQRRFHFSSVSDPGILARHGNWKARDHLARPLAFVLRTPGGKTVLFDPWYTGNPQFPGRREPKAADLILVSHGHSDHITDAAAMAKATGATVVGIWEVTSWLAPRACRPSSR